MRHYLLSFLLLTTAAVPAMAQDQGGRHRNRDGEQASSSQSEEARPTRFERAERPERVERTERADVFERQRPQVSDRANWSDRGFERQRAVEQQAAHQQVFEQRTERRQGEARSWQQRRSEPSAGDQQRRLDAPSTGSFGSYRAERQRDYRRDGRSGDRSLTSGSYQHNRDGQVAVDQRSGDRYQRGSGSTAQWSSQWRRDGHYDWRRYRDRNRSTFRLGYYNDPYGWRYRRFSIGFSLFPSYYQSSYWLDDPWMYRLPPAYGPYRWVRYYDDALLVNIYTGRVVDVVYDFFW